MAMHAYIAMVSVIHILQDHATYSCACTCCKKLLLCMGLQNTCTICGNNDSMNTKCYIDLYLSQVHKRMYWIRKNVRSILASNNYFIQHLKWLLSKYACALCIFVVFLSRVYEPQSGHSVSYLRSYFSLSFNDVWR